MPFGEARRSSAGKVRLLTLVCAGLVAGGCSSDDPTPPTPPKVGGFALVANQLTPQIQPGKSTDIDLTITRTGGFSGAVDFSLSGQPAGVTASYSGYQTSGIYSTAKATLSVDSTVAPGSFYFQLTATGGGVGAHVDLGLVVLRPPPDFAVSANPSPVSILQGGLWTVQVTVAATNFQSETVHLALLDAPPGVTGTFKPDSVSGGNSTLTLVVDPALAPGTYGLTIQGSGPGVPTKTGPLSLTVNPSSGGLGVGLDFSECSAANRPTWLAVQDGAGSAWLPVASNAGVYQATFSQPLIGVAYTIGGTQPALRVSYLTRSEVIAAQPYGYCHQTGNPTLQVTTAGLATGESAYISVGDGVTVASGNGAFQLYPVLSGAHDLVGYKTSSAGVADRFFLLRDQDLGSALSTVDFGAGAAFAPMGAPMQVVGAVTGASTSQTMAFLTGASCDFSLLYSGSPIAGTDFMAYGAPATALRSTDLHQLVVSSADLGNTSFRSVAESFHQIAPRLLVLGSTVPAVTLVKLPGAYKRLELDGFAPSDYQSNLFFSYSVTTEGRVHSASIVASTAWMGGPNVTLVMPDLTGVPGFDAGAPPDATATGPWSFTLTGTSAASLCTEGARTTTATQTGIF